MWKSGAIGVGITILVSYTTALAGDLTPPPGPVAPTDRTTLNPASLGVPIVIDEPGSYVLTGPVLDCIGCDDLPNDGIVINASDVTLDCNGFRIVGDPENSLHGISISFNASNIVIKNGIVRNWSNGGIVGGAPGVAVEDMRVINCGQSNGGNGISLNNQARVIDCVASDNGGIGIFVSYGSLVQGCTASGNGGDGIQTTIGALVNGSVVESCVSRINDGVGFRLGDGTTALGCSATQNNSGGFELAVGAAATSCTAILNIGNGFTAVNALVHGCSAAFNTGNNIDLSFGAVAFDSHDAP